MFVAQPAHDGTSTVKYAVFPAGTVLLEARYGLKGVAVGTRFWKINCICQLTTCAANPVAPARES